jgi:uncharacterized protein (DUF2147 family)
MRNLVVGMVALACALTVSHLAKGEPAGDPRGVWLTEARDTKVRVSKCGQALCGRIIWLKEPIDRMTGRPQIDDKNPDSTLARRPIVGLNLFHSMKPSGDHRSGHIYNTDNGKTYASNVSLVDATTLKVSGCVLFICGRSELRGFRYSRPAL